MKPDDGRCLNRETFVKKDGTLSRIRRQCSRQAEVYPDGSINRLCTEHQREVNETFLRMMDRTRDHSTFVPGTKTIQ